MDIKKNDYLINLYDIYYNLLTKKQKYYLEMYLKCDLSVSEISENDKISKAAVSDSIKKSIQKLLNYEKKLNLYSKQKEIIKYLDSINKLNEEELNNVKKRL